MTIKKLTAEARGYPLNSKGKDVANTVNQLIDTSVASLKSLPASPQTDTVYGAIGFYAGSTSGGGQFVWNPTANKSTHNGGTVIAPEAISAWNGTQADIATLLNWVGSGSGCWVRSDLQGFVTPEMFGAVGDGVADDTESLKSAHSVGKRLNGSSKYNYLVSKSNYIPLIDGCVYDYCFATITVSPECTISDVTGDGFGRYANNIFYRNQNTAMEDSILVCNIKINCLARKINGIGASDTSSVRDDHIGWFNIGEYVFSCIGEVAGGGGPGVLTNALCGSSLNIVGYKLNLENVDVYDCGHGVVGFLSKIFRARNVRTYFCGVSRDFTSWYNCASLLCRTSESIDIEGCSSYVTGGTAYFVSVGSNLSTKSVSIKNCNLTACGLSGIGAGTRSYVETQSKIDSIDIDANIYGWDCAIDADLHSGMKISIEDLNNSTCESVNVRGEINYLAPWETFNQVTYEVDGSYNIKKKKGYSVGSQYGIQCFAVKTGTINKINHVDINVNIKNHQAGGVYVGYCDYVSVRGFFGNNGWNRQSNDIAWPSIIVSSIYGQENLNLIIDATITEQSKGVLNEKVLCTPVLIRGNSYVRVGIDVTENGNQEYPLRDIVDNDSTTLEVARINYDNPVKSGGFEYLIDNSAGTFSKVRHMVSDKNIIALISGSREISPMTSVIKESSISSGVKTVTLLGAKVFDERIVEVVTNSSWAINVAPRSGETINGSTSTINIPINSSMKFISKGGLWTTL